MVKQLPSKNPRPEGFKVKHFLQICLLISICFLIFNQLKNSYGTKRASIEGFRAEKPSESTRIDVKDIAIPGRKHLYPRVSEEKLLGLKEGDDTEDGKEREEETEEVEDLIDVDDRVEGNEERDDEEKGINQLDQYAQNKDELKSQDAMLL